MLYRERSCRHAPESVNAALPPSNPRSCSLESVIDSAAMENRKFKDKGKVVAMSDPWGRFRLTSEGAIQNLPETQVHSVMDRNQWICNHHCASTGSPQQWSEWAIERGHLASTFPKAHSDSRLALSVELKMLHLLLRPCLGCGLL